MGWSNYLLLGQLGNRIDLDKADEKLKRMRQRMVRQSGRDDDQDSRIRVLETENDEIKLMLMELMNTLVQRGALTEQETVDMVHRVAQLVPATDEDDDDPLRDLQQALE